MPGSLLEDPLDSIPIPHPATSTEPTADPPSLTSSLRTATAHVSCRLLLSWQPETQKKQKRSRIQNQNQKKSYRHRNQRPTLSTLPISFCIFNFVAFPFGICESGDLGIRGSGNLGILAPGHLGTWGSSVDRS